MFFFLTRFIHTCTPTSTADTSYVGKQGQTSSDRQSVASGDPFMEEDELVSICYCVVVYSNLCVEVAQSFVGQSELDWAGEMVINHTCSPIDI